MSWAFSGLPVCVLRGNVVDQVLKNRQASLNWVAKAKASADSTVYLRRKTETADTIRIQKFSGVLISCDVIMTAAHSTNGPTAAAEIVAGDPADEVKALDVRVHRLFARLVGPQNSQPSVVNLGFQETRLFQSFDLALVKVPKGALPNQPAEIASQDVIDEKFSKQARLWFSGYGRQKPNDPQSAGTLKFAEVVSNPQNDAGPAVLSLLESSGISLPGDSGSPVWEEEPRKLKSQVVGVLHGGMDDQSESLATMLTPRNRAELRELYKQLNSSCPEQNPF